MINFKYVRWKNFLSTGNQPTEIQLDKNPTTLIIGENGAGKSTVLDALCFGLFGKPFRTISKSQLVNSINNGATMVEIEFSIGTVEYKVMRGIKPNKFEIYQNGKMMNQEANVRDYQKILEQNILKLNYGSFTQVVILGSSTFVPFMQLKARHRREVVEEILDIKIFSTMNLILKGKLKTLLEDIRDIDYQYELTSEKIHLQENLIADMKQNKTKIIEQKQKLIDTNAAEIKSRVEEKLKRVMKTKKPETGNYLTEGPRMKVSPYKIMSTKNTAYINYLFDYLDEFVIKKLNNKKITEKDNVLYCDNSVFSNGRQLFRTVNAYKKGDEERIMKVISGNEKDHIIQYINGDEKPIDFINTRPTKKVSKKLVDKHFFRKHGKNKYSWNYCNGRCSIYRNKYCWRNRIR